MKKIIISASTVINYISIIYQVVRLVA